MAKVATSTPKKEVTKKTVVTPLNVKIEAIEENPLSGKHYSEEEKEKMPTKIVFIENIRENKNLSADDISNFKNETSLQHLVLKNQAIANNVNRGNMLAFERDAVDNEHKRLTGNPFFKTDNQDGKEQRMFTIVFDLFVILALYLAARTIGRQQNTIVEIANRHNSLLVENLKLKEKIASLTPKGE